MSKIYTSNFRFNNFVFFLVLLFSSVKANAQIDISIGTGTAGNTNNTYPCPIQDWFEGSRMQYLYRASELTAAGMGPGNINSLKYNVISVGTAGIVEQHTIKIGGTSAVTLGATTWEPGTTTVYGPVNYQPVVGVNTFTFTTPYFWNGTDNIVIEICGGEPGNATGTWFTENPIIPWTVGLAFNGSHNYRADNLGNLCGTATTTNTGTQTTRPNVTMNWTPAAACLGTPTAGTAVANPTIVCLGTPFTLSVTGATVASGLTYQWQSSPDNIIYTDIAGATAPSLTTTQTVSTYYHLVVTCTAGGSATSTNVQVTSPSLVNGTFTINSALPTGGTNFQTFNDAYSYIKCGIDGPVIFNVNAASGPYNEQLIMTPVPGASATNTVTFNGNGRTISFLSTNTNERGVIKLNGADHIKFDNLVITALGTATTEYGFGVQLLNDADSNAVTNSIININSTSTSTNYAGIVMSASATGAITTGNTLSDGNVFRGNTISGGYYGITCIGSTTAANRDNNISGNLVKDFYSFGIYILGNFNTQIDSNTITRPERATVIICNAIYITSLNVSVNVTRNTITDPYGGAPASTAAFNGIFITGTDALSGVENKIINNRIYNITGAGEANGINNTGSDNVWIQHNTILMDGAGGTGTALTRGFYQTTLAAGVRFENNIVAITRTSTGAKYATYHNTITSDIYSNDNVFFITPGLANAFTGFYTTAQASLANWQAASGDDVNSLSSNPVFTDIFTGNLRPTSASVDNQGAPVGVLIDITALPRSATSPDMGAYEFTPAACTTPPIAGTTTLNPSTVCFNQTVSIGLTGSFGGLGQTYQWQVSLAFGGPYTNIGNVLTNPDSVITASVTQFYRVAVTCSGFTGFSEPALLTVNPALPGGAYSIDQFSLPSATNFVSFNAAKAAMACGIAGNIIFNVSAGTGPYNEQLILDSIAGMNQFSITFNGNGNTIAFSSNDGNERAVIKLRKADRVTFNDLVIDATGTGTFGYGVQLFNNADSNTINNCTIQCNATSTSTNYGGIILNNSEAGAATTGNTFCDNNTFSGNIINGGYYGITIVGGTTATTFPVLNNKVTGNTILDFYQYGVYISGTSNTLVESNFLSRPSRTAITNFYGVYATAVSIGLKVSKNRFTNPFGGNPASTSQFGAVYLTGVDAVSGSVNIVSNNLVYGINGDGIQYGLYNSGSDNARYYHNTISLQDNANNGTAATYGFFQTLLADGIEVKNNIFTITRNGDGNKFALNFVTNPSGIISNNNDLYVTGNNSFTGFNGTNRVTLADWRAATGQDANSVAFDPIYASPGSGNFTPIFPPMDNLGTPVGITTDILNAVRSASIPDIGAYEFSVPPCTAPPAVGSAIANPNTGFCLGTNIALSLNGYNFGGGQTYQWEYSTSATGPWLPLGGPRLFPDTTILASGSYYYHVLVTCGGNTVISGNAQVTMNPAFLSGYYTINPATPPFYPTAGSTNFASFASAVAELDCGITGFVTFDVAPGIYNEQVRMHNITGTSATSRVTFRSANADPTSVTLTFDATVAANNYVLKLDSAKYITYKNMTIEAVNTTNGRGIQLAGTASFDSILNCRINVPASTLATNTTTGIIADLLRGAGNVIKGNTVTNGSNGIYFTGVSATILTYDNVIDSNTVNNSYNTGVYILNNGRVTVSRNTVNVSMPRNATNYAIYSSNSDSAFKYTANKVNIDGVTATNTYGMYFTGCDGKASLPGIIAGNTIMALTGNTANIYGMYQTASIYNNTVNNVISIKTTGATSYGSYSTASGGVKFQNNTIVSTATSATNNIAAYFSQTSAVNPPINIRNNIFSHEGGGRAMYVANIFNIYTDYNTFYTTGTNLIQWNANNYTTLQRWRDTSYWDLNSIAIKPLLISTSDLRPDITSPDVWAIHGRGTQIPGNDYDFNNNPRPTTFTTGVPDMGAYEFLPTSLPTVLIPTPAVPAPGITQTFMYGTDTVAKIKYDATAAVPASISMRRFSGVLPTGLSAGQNSMYFYTALDVPAQGAYKYKMEQYYIDPWRGFIPTEPKIKMGRTNAAAAWEVGASSSSDNFANIITDTNLVFIDKYTGLEGDAANTPGGYTTVIDTSNRGTRFWVPYGHHQGFNTNSQNMWLYLSAQDSANVTVRINGTSWKKVYAIPANTVKVSDLIPKSGLIDARVLNEGLYEHGISITSDVPIVAYAHIYDGANSGASLLLPVGVYGYEYQSLNFTQNYAADCFSWFAVMSDRDSTLVQITPAVNSRAGRPAGVPFNVLLMKGEVYNVMGTTNGAAGTDMSGSKIKSIANASGKCYPIAVFSGSTRTSICTGGGDNFISQVFPTQAWGKKYLTFATATQNSTTNYNSNIYRVLVKDPATVVTASVNGVVIPVGALVVPGNYYQFFNTFGNGPNSAVYIESDKPVMVSQYMVSGGASSCPGITAPGVGDPEMMYVSPIEQGIKKAAFYSTNNNAITSTYVNVVIPTAGLTSLVIDGATTFTNVFAHPGLPGYSCVRHNLTTNPGQHNIKSDSAFTSITYGIGTVESYGYNAGTLVKNLNALPNIANTLGTSSVSSYTCVNAPFRFNILITAQPQVLTWQFSVISSLTPNVDVIQNNPVPISSVVINGKTFYKYTVATDYKFTAPGTFYIPILVKDTSTIEGCENTQEIILPVTVIPAPVADFTAVFSGCIGAPVILSGIGTTANGTGINTWDWNFGDLTNGTGQNTSHTYLSPGTYNITLNMVALDGCVDDTTKPITVNALPPVQVVNDSLVVCGNSSATFEILNPDPGSTYDWFTTLTGGTPLFTGPVYTVPSVTGTVEFFVQATNAAGCISERKRVKATLLPDLANPIARVDSVAVDKIYFGWDAVPNAVTYEVSIDNGATWITPSSGAAGLNHTVTGLLPLQDVSLIVRAKGTVSCQLSVSTAVTGKTLPDQVYIPNAFTPNGDGLNDILLVYGYIIKEMRFTVFNQWGEKIFESSNQSTGWNGTYNGKKQPSGVYMYVCQLTLKDGTTQVKKGSINLVR
jgi:gliding motility-associated-like protein